MIKKGTKFIDLMNEEEKLSYLHGKQQKNTERSNTQKVLRLFAKKIKELGFDRTKPTFFVRESDFVIEFLHLHKFSFGPCFRMHICIRVLNDTRSFVALSGPSEKELDSTVSFDFDDSKESIEGCATNMAEFVVTHVEPWFQQWAKGEALLNDNSPLHDDDKVSLREALNGKAEEKNIELSKQLFKIV
jgi:hypothetical protein